MSRGRYAEVHLPPSPGHVDATSRTVSFRLKLSPTRFAAAWNVDPRTDDLATAEVSTQQGVDGPVQIAQDTTPEGDDLLTVTPAADSMSQP